MQCHLDTYEGTKVYDIQKLQNHFIMENAFENLDRYISVGDNRLSFISSHRVVCYVIYLRISTPRDNHVDR